MNITTIKRAARRRRMLDAAMDLIAERGLEALTISSLAGRLGMSVGGLYRYFEGKEAILVALQEHAIARFAEEQRAALDRAEHRLRASRFRAHEPIGMLYRLVATFSVYLGPRPDAQHRLLDTFVSAPGPFLSDERARAVNALLHPILGVYRELFEDAVRCGALAPGDPLQRTHIVWAAVHGLDHFRKRDRLQPRHLRTGALLHETYRTLLGGWGANPAAIERALTLGG